MPEASDPTLMEGAVEGGAGNWGEVVTRQPYRKVRLDHLLSKEKKQVRKLVILFSYQEIGNKISGGDAPGGNTRTHPEHDG